MILDKLARFSDAQTTTASTASTDVVDTVAAGDSYEGAWFVALIDTTFTGTSTASNQFQLQTSASETFVGGAATLCQSAAYLIATLTAGKMYACRIPAGARRYLRGYKVLGGSGVMSTGAYDMFIVKDIDMESINRRYMLAAA